jgi:hypothetical protein
MAQLVDIFLQPGAVFAQQRERPTFLVPWLIVAALTVAFTLAYFLRVDPDWHVEAMFAASNADMTAAEIAQAKAVMPAAKTMGWIGAATATLALAVAALLTALYVFIAAKITGHALTYRHGLSLSAWSSMPVALGLIVALVGALTMSAQTSIESLMLTNVDPLLVDLSADHRWNKLAQGFSLLTPWTVGLMALGWRAWTRSSWLQAIVIALIPTAVVYGVIALLP